MTSDVLVGRVRWQAHTHTPVFKPYNQFGEHINRIDYHPAYHSLISQAIEHHVPSFAWVHRGEAGSHVVRAALGYMQYQADYGVSCPITMTFACVPALENTPSIADNWVPKLTSGMCVCPPALASAPLTPFRAAMRQLRQPRHPRRGEAGRHDGHVHDGEAGRLRRPRQHNPGNGPWVARAG